jgi:hypothetical protein
MKGVMSTSLLFTIMAVSAGAQEAMPIAQSDADQTAPTAQQGVSLIDHWRMATPADPATNAVTLPGPTQNGYGSGDYGGCVEIFPSGYNVIGNQVGANGIAQPASGAAGPGFGHRFHLNSPSSVKGRYGFSRNSHKFTIGSAVSSIPSYFSEISGSDIYNFATEGAVLFNPGNRKTPTGVAVRRTRIDTCPGIEMPTGYPYAVVESDGHFSQVYTGSFAGAGTQSRGMLYGGGVEVPLSRHFYFRREFRALMYEAPDFQVKALQTNGTGFNYEPSFFVAYRF